MDVTGDNMLMTYPTSSSNPCIGPLPRIKMSFFLLSTSTDELISAPNIITFLPNLVPSDNEKLLCASNPVPLSEYLYLSKSTFLVNLTAPNKEFPNGKSLPTVNYHKFIS